MLTLQKYDSRCSKAIFSGRLTFQPTSRVCDRERKQEISVFHLSRPQSHSVVEGYVEDIDCQTRSCFCDPNLGGF